MDQTGKAGELAELRELRAHIRSLEAEVARLRSSRAERGRYDRDRDEERKLDEHEISDTVRDIADRSEEEVSKLVRALTLGYLEQVRLIAEAVEGFANRVSDRNRPDRDDTVEDLARRLPRDVSAELLEAVHRTLDIPGRVVERVRESYREAEDQPRVQRHRQASGNQGAAMETSDSI